jgi:hypothetical protein
MPMNLPGHGSRKTAFASFLFSPATAPGKPFPTVLRTPEHMVSGLVDAISIGDNAHYARIVCHMMRFSPHVPPATEIALPGFCETPGFGNPSDKNDTSREPLTLRRVVLEIGQTIVEPNNLRDTEQIPRVRSVYPVRCLDAIAYHAEARVTE